jgi:hypothetical protein
MVAKKKGKRKDLTIFRRDRARSGWYGRRQDLTIFKEDKQKFHGEISSHLDYRHKNFSFLQKTVK